MRKVNWVILHCSDSDVPSHDNIETIRKWHTLPLIPKSVEQGIKDGKIPKEESFKYGRGWKDIGYHYFISKDGVVRVGRNEDAVGSHTRGHNSGSIGICLSGRTGFTAAQFQSLEGLLKDICTRHKLNKQDILAHKDLDPKKTCPNFDVHELVSKYNWH